MHNETLTLSSTGIMFDSTDTTHGRKHNSKKEQNYT